ncbi:MAG: hypothetical protein FD188_1171 [Ignavibacteria bacterium]|nr:MAG: hypothetical protein FD188_1171 [Ignavibacteria bacterium]
MQKLIILFLFTCTTIFAQATNGLIAYYPFNGNANDESGNNLHATLMNNPSFVTGAIGQAVKFTSIGVMGANGSHVLLPEALTSLVASAAELTISMWVNEESIKPLAGGEAYIYFGDTKVFTIGHEVGGSAPAGSMIIFGDVTKYYPYDNNNTLKWAHYTVTFKNNVLNCYVNSSLVISSPYIKEINGSAAALGRHWWGGGGLASNLTSTRFTGSMDEVRVYNRALNNQEISELYNLSSNNIYSLNITDQSGGSKDLQFGLDPTATDGIDATLGEYVVPPMPPAGSFDTRFVLPGNIDNSLTDIRNGSNTSFVTKEHIIQYQVGTGTNIKLSWNLPVGVYGRLQDRVLGTIIDVPMSGSGDYTVANPSVVSSLKMTINYMLGSLPTPVLKSPANNSIDQLLSPTLIWHKSQYADKYKLQVAKDANFANIVFEDSTITDTTKQITNLEAVTKYFWRVRAKNSQAANPISSYPSVNNFTTELIAPKKPTLLFPGNNAVNIPLKPKLLWSKSKYASGYNIEFQGGWTGKSGTTSDTTMQFDFLKPGTQHTWKIQAYNSKGVSGFTDVFYFTTAPTDWNLSLFIQDRFLLLGHANAINANDQINSIYGEETLPPVPPAGVLDARLLLPGGDASLGDFRNSSEEKTTWILSFQPSSTGYPITIKWGLHPAPEGTLYIKDRIDGSIVNINMKTQDSVRITNQALTSLQIEYNKQITVNASLNSGWNMVSVPVIAASLKGTDLFSSANSQIFGFNGGYTIETNLTLGKGYWVRYAAGKTEAIKGTLSKTNRIALNSGWNMIGVYDKEVQVNQIVSTPANIVNSSYFEFNNGYVIASSLKPGKGYWARTSQAGELTFPYTVSKTSAQIANVIDKDWSRIIIQDAGYKTASLYLSRNSEGSSKLDLPPAPPAGIFDVRWASEKLVESSNGINEIVFNYAEYPITLKFENCDLWIKDKINGLIINQLVKKGESLTITNKAIERLEVKATELPTEFELYQIA